MNWLGGLYKHSAHSTTYAWWTSILLEPASCEVQLTLCLHPRGLWGKIVVCHNMDSYHLTFSRGSLSYITFSENGEVTSLRPLMSPISLIILESRLPSYSEHCTKSPALSELYCLRSLPPSLLFFPFSFPKQDAAKEIVKCLAQWIRVERLQHILYSLNQKKTCVWEYNMIT